MSKKDRKENKKFLPRNFKINTRIILTNTIAAVLVLILVFIISMVVRGNLPSFLNASKVDTQSYSVLNQLQWSQTMSSLSKELSSAKDGRLSKSAQAIVTDLENIGCLVRIDLNESNFYSTEYDRDILSVAKSITTVDTSRNMNYFGDNGLVIVNHIMSNGNVFTILILNEIYAVDNYSDWGVNQDIASVIFGRTGFVIAAVVLIFVIAIFVISLISSKTISEPISKLAKGSEELSKGNFDYVIDYDSTNEIGQTVKSFNYMVGQMKSSMEARNSIELSRKEMIAGVAHDLRTPLTSVKGYVEGLRDGIADTPEKQMRYLQTIYSSTLDMERLLNELLTTSRLELGQIQLQKEIVDLNAFLGDCSEDLADDLDRKGFDFEYVNPYENEKIFVSIDADRFSRVIANLISNSVKYADKSRKGRIILDVKNYSKSVIISLTDNGIGVSSENISKIFDTFFRADQARTRVREGSGIGLSVCRQIVELHGGRIWATSKQGEGLTVLISLEKITEVDYEQENIDS